MIRNRDLRDRLKASTDESFASPSSTLAERMSGLAMASSTVRPPFVARFGRRFATALASVGIIGWMTMAGAGAMVTVAAVGDLPDPVQQFVADVVDHVGIDLPDPRHDEQVREAEQNGSTGGSSGSTSGPTGASTGGSTGSTVTTVAGPGNDDVVSSGSAGAGAGAGAANSNAGGNGNGGANASTSNNGVGGGTGGGVTGNNGVGQGSGGGATGNNGNGTGTNNGVGQGSGGGATGNNGNGSGTNNGNGANNGNANGRSTNAANPAPDTRSPSIPASSSHAGG